MQNDKISINMPEETPQKVQPSKLDAAIFSKPQNIGLLILKALVLGAIGALIGGLLWYIVAYYLNLEIAILTIGIGIVVGGAMRSMIEKRSFILGVIAAVMTAGGILFGQYLLYYSIASDEVENSIAEVLSERMEEESLLSSEEQEAARAELLEEVDMKLFFTLYTFRDFLMDSYGLSEGLELDNSQEKSMVYSWLFTIGAIVAGGYMMIAKDKTQPVA